MDDFAMSTPSQGGESTEFDNLCDLCASLFDADVTWEEDVYRPHHDIYSLSRSAEAGCHLCSLMLGQILPETVKLLQDDLDGSTVAPSQQIKVNIKGEEPEFTLEIAARNRTTPRYHSWRRNNGWAVIGELIIQRAEDNYSNRARSTAILNCCESTIAQITHWLENCITSHTKCFDVQVVAATREVLPKRLLDLRFAAQEGRVRLIMSQSLPHDTIYATLSHCWGGQCEKTLTVEGLKDFEEGLLVSSLPKTFQDAVHVSTKLSISYLWIDALCIIQDSVDNLEWKQEASIMGDVYANSYVTLAATTSSNSQGGLLHQRNPLSVWPCRLTATWECFIPGDLVVGTSFWAHEPDMKPLEDRAWAFQEWLLSKRLIHFSNDQVRWECYSLAASEVYPNGLDKVDLLVHGTPTKGIVSLLRNEPKYAHTRWGRIRSEYSGKALTKATDKLAAFSGIARMVHKVLGSPKEDYLAGLWKPNLLQELLWEKHGDEGQPHSADLYIAPTWSWASLNGPFWETEHWHANILDTKISPVDDDFGLSKVAVSKYTAQSATSLYPHREMGFQEITTGASRASMVYLSSAGAN